MQRSEYQSSRFWTSTIVLDNEGAQDSSYVYCNTADLSKGYYNSFACEDERNYIQITLNYAVSA